MKKPWKDIPDTPWWVWVLTDCGRPVMTLVVLVLCAPGEQHLAQLAGWSPVLSWGMASLLAAYAGIAAVIGTRRAKGAPGKRSAVAGAIIALLLAMIAQPVAHLFVTGWLSATPRTPWELVVIVSSVPPLVLGHLLHLAAGPDRLAAVVTRTEPVRPPVSAPRPQAAPADTVRTTVPAQPSVPAQPVRPAVPAADKARTTVSAPVPQTDTDRADTPQDTAPDSRTNVAQIGQAHGLAALVRELDALGMSDADIRAEVLRQLPDTKPDTLGKTLRRVRGPRHARTA